MAPPPLIPGSMQQQQRVFGMPPGGPPLPNQSMTMGQTGQSKIDPNQIPRLTPSSTVILHETRQNNQANPPPVISLLIAQLNQYFSFYLLKSFIICCIFTGIMVRVDSRCSNC